MQAIDTRLCYAHAMLTAEYVLCVESIETH